MIIAATRILTSSGHRPLADHIWRGGDTDAVITLQGCAADVADMVATARAAGRRYGVRHYHLSPGEPMTDREALDVVARLAAEFGFDLGAAVVIRHQKGRRVCHDPMLGTQGHGEHWHVLVPEVDPVTGRTLDSSWMHPRHERVARETELRLLHKVIRGRFNSSVIRALAKRDAHKAADRLREAGLEEGWPAYASYTGRQRRVLERRHAGPQKERLDVPSLVRRLIEAWAAHAPNPLTLQAALRREGLRLRHPADPPPAERNGRPIAPAPGTAVTGWVVDAWDAQSRVAYVLGAAHRLLRERRARVVETLRPLERPADPAAVPSPTGPYGPGRGRRPRLLEERGDVGSEQLPRRPPPSLPGAYEVTWDEHGMGEQEGVRAGTVGVREGGGMQPPSLRRPDAQVVDDGSGRASAPRGVLAITPQEGAAQRRDALVAADGEPAMDGLPGQAAVGEHPPANAGAEQDSGDPVDDLAGQRADGWKRG